MQPGVVLICCFSCCLLFPPLLPARLTLNCSPGSRSSRRECVVFIKERKCANEHRGPKISGVLILFPLVALFTSGGQLIAYTDSKFVYEALRLRETGWRDTHTPLTQPPASLHAEDWAHILFVQMSVGAGTPSAGLFPWEQQW